MQFRHGTCSSCKAEYKIPASFASDRARCKKCGGVVEIGPVQDGDAPSAAPVASAPPVAATPPPPPVPAAPPPPARPQVPPPAPVKPPAPPVPVAPVAKTPPSAPPKPVAPVKPPAPRAEPKPVPAAPAKLEEVTPSGRARSGPTMKEKLLARRAAEAAASGGAGEAPPAPQAAPSSRGQAGRSGPSKAPPVREPARARPSAPSKPAAAAAAPAIATGAVAGTPRASSRAGSAGKRPARGGSSRGRSGGKGRGDDAKKRNPMLIVGSLVGLVVIGVGGYFLLLGGDEPVQAKDGAIPATIEDGAKPAQQAAADAVPASGDGDTATEAAQGSDAAPGEAEPELKDAEPAEAAEAAPPAKAAEKDPSEIDLAAIPDFGPIAGTSPERWKELQEKAALVVDPAAAAAGNRARIALEEADKAAFPAILNVMKTLDYATEDGYRNGDILQRTLMKIANNQNFGWKYSTEPNDVWFNKKVVEMWSTQWERSQDDEGYWLRFTKQEAKADEAKGEAPIDSETESALDDLDDL